MDSSPSSFLSQSNPISSQQNSNNINPTPQIIDSSSEQSYQSLIGSSETSQKQANERDEVKQMIQLKKEDFREDIRRAKTKATLQQKRIKVFQEFATLKTEETCKQNIRILLTPDNNIQDITGSLSYLKQMSSELSYQPMLLNPEILTFLVSLLDQKYTEYEQIQLDACWIITNLSCNQDFNISNILPSGSSSGILNLSSYLDTQLIAYLIQHIHSPNIAKINVAFWCLSNLAGDKLYTQKIYQANILQHITGLLQSPQQCNEEIICQITYIYLNITDQLQINEETSVSSILSAIEQFSSIKNDEILYNLIKILSNLSKVEQNSPLIKKLSQGQLINQIFTVLALRNMYYLEESLELAGNLLNLDQSLSQVLLTFGLKDILVQCMEGKELKLRKKAGWVLSVAFGCGQQVIGEFLEDERILNKLLSLMIIDSLELKVILTMGLLKAMESATSDQIEKLINAKLINVLYQLMNDEKNEHLLLLSLEILRILLRFNKEHYLDNGSSKDDVIIEQMMDCGLVEVISFLQTHPSDAVYKKTANIINDFFDFEEANNAENQQ